MPTSELSTNQFPLPLHQLRDEASGTCTYVLYDPVMLEAVIIDPVREQVVRDMALLASLGLRLCWSIETHAHADHYSGTGELSARSGAGSAAPLACGIAASKKLADGDILHFGDQALHAIHTPGHTAGSMCFWWSFEGRGNVFTGDTLLIDGCGRTDFQLGSAAALFDSVHHRLFNLPDDTTVYPGHDYNHVGSSTIGQEKRTNQRFTDKTKTQFIELMTHLPLPLPKLMGTAVPFNLELGTSETPTLPKLWRRYDGKT